MTDLTTIDVHSRAITAFFDTRDAANKAESDLIAAGIPREHVTIAGSDAAAGASAPRPEDKGFLESLKDLFLPDEDRSLYAEGLRRGGYVVSVNTDEANYTRVLAILDRDGAVDLDQREASWRSEGWTGYGAGVETAATTTTALAAASTAPAAASTAPAALGSPTGLAAPSRGARADSAAVGRDEVIPVYEEQLRVGKRDVNHGRVRVRSYVVETPVTEQVSLREESVQVERRPVDRPVSATDALFQDRVIEAEEHIEEAVIAKEARVKEEITLRKTAEDRTQTVSDSVRHTEVEVQDERHLAVATTSSTATVASRIVAQMDVVGADGVKIGTVDHLDGPEKIKLAKSTSPDGQHHYVPLTWIDHVDAHVHLTKTSAEAKAGW